VNSQKSAPLIKLLWKIGAWPLLTGNWNGAGTNLVDLIATIFKETGLSILLNVDIIQDVKNATNYIIKVTTTV